MNFRNWRVHAIKHSELTHWKRLWCWEGLGAGGKQDNRGWDSWMASPTQRIWVWVNSRSWWWTGRSGVLQLMGSQRVEHDWATELNRFRDNVELWLFDTGLLILQHGRINWDCSGKNVPTCHDVVKLVTQLYQL